MTIKERSAFLEKVKCLFKVIHRDDQDNSIELIDSDNFVHRFEFAKSLIGPDYLVSHMVFDHFREFCFNEMWYFDSVNYNIIEEQRDMVGKNKDKVFERCKINMNELFRKMDLLTVKII